MERIRNSARILTDEELKEKEIKDKELKDKLMTELTNRKDEMKKLDMERRANEKLNELEEEARQKAQYLLSKAMEQRQDEEEEIKQLNAAITNAKIQTIRDAQVLEKQQIKKELAEENDRLDRMMEMDRQNALQIQTAIETKRKEAEMLGACEIINQINQNEQERLLRLEKTEQENMAVRKKIASEMLEEMNRRIDRKTKQQLLREELDKCNDSMRKMRLKKAEEERLLDLKIMQEQKAKAEREAAFEEEQRCIRCEKERETNRLRGLQERAIDLQAEKNALRAKRAMEENERQWRRKELAAAKRAQEAREEMNRERIRAEENKTRLLAMEATRNKVDFERILQHQKELIEKDRLEEKRRNKMKMEFCNDLKKQICEKEQQRIAERNAFFEEGVRMEEEARLRRLRLEDAKNRKMEELRKAGIPEKYLAEIERKAGQLNITNVKI
uniref:Cilia- and flagella-associated protein 45 n=1 Tax=Echinococcus granulosus TaxID=6210 RepID=A0A068WJB4_ECHGR|nr:coiled coil domain containing 19 [Echinococcus granulosus]